MLLSQLFLFAFLRIQNTHLLQNFLAQVIFAVDGKSNLLLEDEVFLFAWPYQFLNYNENRVVVSKALG